MNTNNIILADNARIVTCRNARSQSGLKLPRLLSVADRARAAAVVATADRAVAITVLRRTRAGLGTPVQCSQATPVVQRSNPALRPSVELLQERTWSGAVLSLLAVVAVIFGGCWAAGWVGHSERAAYAAPAPSLAVAVDAISGGTF